MAGEKGKENGKYFMNVREPTKEVILEAVIWNIFINKKAFRACNAASQQLNKIFVVDVTDKINFIKEMIHPLSCIEEKPLDCNGFSIRQNSLLGK